MATHDYNVANASGATVRSDINDVLSAIVTWNSGTSWSTTFARMRVADTTTGVIKRRNAANSGWIFESTDDETRVVARSSNTILDESDITKAFKATSTFTQTLTAAATLGDGWWVRYRNDGTGIITIDPNASETIDGATTMYLYPGEGCTIACDGSNFKTTGRSSGWVEIQKQSASASATIDFTIGITSDFDVYKLTITDVIPATDNVATWLRVSEDGGSTFKAGASDYKWNRSTTYNAGTALDQGSEADTKIIATLSITSDASAACEVEVLFFNPAGTTRRKHFLFRAVMEDTNPQCLYSHGGGVYVGTTNAINAIRVLMSSGNITSGTFTLYGLRK